ncbi:hypothetical protein [Cytobacillus gottheilii]
MVVMDDEMKYNIGLASIWFLHYWVLQSMTTKGTIQAELIPSLFR